MTRVEQIESDVQMLSREELDAFRHWFHEYEADVWDRKMEADIIAGKLDQLAQKALADHQSGRSTEL